MQDVFDSIIAEDRWMRVSYSKCRKSEFYNSDVDRIVRAYLDDYVDFYKIESADVISSYNEFILLYSQDVITFIETRKYPFQNNKIQDYDRNTYDLVLLLSILLSTHRHRIFCELMRSLSALEGSLLLVGIGSGIELEIISRSSVAIDAYDTSISEFTKLRFGDVNLNERVFSGTVPSYSAIFAIELLEHLENPLIFVNHCIGSLVAGGNLFVTTATNIPQSDHLYNFESLSDFENAIHDMNCTIGRNIEILHDSINGKLNASNNWYQIVKN